MIKPYFIMKIMKYQDLKLIVGLGNPDEEYANTYHNAGFLFVDYLNKQQLAHNKQQVLKTDTYMNESGKFVAKMLKKTGAKPEEILLVHDDSDIEIGNYKISFSRGSAGHHGVESVIKSLKTKNFWRLRIGIRPALRLMLQRGEPLKSKKKSGLPAEAHRAKAGEFVLKKISKKDLEIFEKVFEEIKKRPHFLG